MLTCTSPGEAARLRTLRAFAILDTEPEEAFEGITRLAKSALQVPMALVSLVDRDRQWFKSRIGFVAPESGRDISFCGHAIEMDEPMIVRDALKDPRFADNPLVLGEPHIRFYLGAQIRTRDGFNLGTVCCLDTVPREPSKEQIAILRDLAQLAVDEMELRKLAFTDGLTGAMTRRAFFDAGRRDLALARRHRRPFACVMFDVDHFKRINDGYGHAAGDDVLEGLAALFRSHLRQSDYMGRLGGEEFAIVLRETDREGAFEFADRLRQSLSEKAFSTTKGDLEVTASAGVAEYDGACSFEDMLARADAALYQAKQAGRNRTTLFCGPVRPFDPTLLRASPGAALTRTSPLNLACWLTHGKRKQACRVTSHYDGVLLVTLEAAPEGGREARVTLQSDDFGRLEGAALWIGERQFALSVELAAPQRAKLAQIVGDLPREPMTLLIPAA